MAARPERRCPESGYTFECIGNCLNPLPECQRSLAAGELRYAEVERMVDEISDDEREDGFIEP